MTAGYHGNGDPAADSYTQNGELVYVAPPKFTDLVGSYVNEDGHALTIYLDGTFGFTGNCEINNGQLRIRTEEGMIEAEFYPQNCTSSTIDNWLQGHLFVDNEGNLVLYGAAVEADVIKQTLFTFYTKFKLQ